MLPAITRTTAAMIHVDQLRAGFTTGVIGRRGPPGRLPPPDGRGAPGRWPPVALPPVAFPGVALPGVALASLTLASPALASPALAGVAFASLAFPAPGLPAALADFPVTRIEPGSDLLLPPCGVLMLMGPRCGRCLRVEVRADGGCPHRDKHAGSPSSVAVYPR